jgi:undecaprenyl-diphosphatase
MDFAISNWIYNTFGANKAFAIFWAIVSFLGNTWAVVVTSAVLLWFKKTRKLGVYIAITCLMVFVMNSIVIKNLIERPRPFVLHPEFAVICENAGMDLLRSYSMFSGHAANSMAMAMLVFKASKKWGGIAFIYPFMIGISRIALCVHHTTDVLAGWAFGAIVAIGLYYLLEFFWNNYINKKGKNNGKNSSSISKQTQN